MYQIKKLRINCTLDFAAEELKKYLRMMMPHCGDIPISYEPEAADGFRLGLLEDFGLPCEAPDSVLDDVVHIEATEAGGILAGSNPRSVLFAVLRKVKFLIHVPRRKAELFADVANVFPAKSVLLHMKE